MREVLREQKVQATTGLKAIDFLMEEAQWQGHSREGIAQKSSEEMLKEKFKKKKEEKAAHPLERKQHGEVSGPTADGNVALWNKGEIATRGAEFDEEEEKRNQLKHFSTVVASTS